MAVQNDDLLLVQRGTQPFRETTANLATFVNSEITSGGAGADVPTASASVQGVVRVGNNLTIDGNGILDAVIPSGLEFQGVWNQTDTVPATGDLIVGNFFIWNGANGATLNNAAWGTANTQTVNSSDRLMWALGDNFQIIPLAVGGGGVQAVTGAAPIVVDSTTDPDQPEVSITAATTGAAGSMSAADKTKLDGVSAGAEVNVNPSQAYTVGTRTLTLTPGGDTTQIPVATTDDAGLMSAADKTTLDNISSNPSGVASITAGDGISIDADTPAVPVVSVAFGAATNGTPVTVMPYDISMLGDLP